MMVYFWSQTNPDPNAMGAVVAVRRAIAQISHAQVVFLKRDVVDTTSGCSSNTTFSSR